MKNGISLIALAALMTAAPALAELPGPVRAMIETAIASGDAATVAAVVTVATKTNPDDAAEIEALHQSFLHKQAELAAAKEQEKKDAIRNAGMLENWKGRGEFGGFRSTGNTDQLGLTTGADTRRDGIDWSHRVQARVDIQRSSGSTTREQYFASYEPRYQMQKNLFAYGLAQFESNRFQGFDERYSVSGGIGYHLIDKPSLDLSIKAGPAFRHTDFTLEEDESALAGLFGIDFDWRITDRLTLTQDTNAVAQTGGQATVFFGGSNTTLNLITGLDAKVSDRLTTRFSYNVDYDSKPPVGAVSTDTQSRFSVVYGF